MREAFGEAFDVPPGYLNTAAIGLSPVSAADTLVDAIAQWRSRGPADHRFRRRRCRCP
ncbi:hypothetical protein BZL29_7776 [Mycobacterium kansasii]|uniref:Uncharacterized protein n=1 Tax=Mycobacterium kansasii TaxID=1768 RepID=A0A1V3WDY3_MYCKA|nr:hypothetical protein BZL29_7776 [Mycobacterium kansasii]